jgi:hypothetical protein
MPRSSTQRHAPTTSAHPHNTICTATAAVHHAWASKGPTNSACHHSSCTGPGCACKKVWLQLLPALLTANSPWTHLSPAMQHTPPHSPCTQPCIAMQFTQDQKQWAYTASHCICLQAQCKLPRGSCQPSLSNDCRGLRTCTCTSAANAAAAARQCRTCRPGYVHMHLMLAAPCDSLSHYIRACSTLLLCSGIQAHPTKYASKQPLPPVLPLACCDACTAMALMKPMHGRTSEPPYTRVTECDDGLVRTELASQAHVPCCSTPAPRNNMEQTLCGWAMQCFWCTKTSVRCCWGAAPHT